MDKYTELFKKKLLATFRSAAPKKANLAADAGLSRSQLDKYLDAEDETSPTLETVSRLSDALDTDLLSVSEGATAESLALIVAEQATRIKQLEAEIAALRPATGPEIEDAKARAREKIQKAKPKREA